jgi:hypothetical protein
MTLARYLAGAPPDMTSGQRTCMVIGRITVDRVDVHNRIGHARSTAADGVFHPPPRKTWSRTLIPAAEFKSGVRPSQGLTAIYRHEH